MHRLEMSKTFHRDDSHEISSPFAEKNRKNVMDLSLANFLKIY